MSKCSDKIILITGCSSGIGLCCALALHQEGYRIIATVRTESDKKILLEKGIRDVVLLDLSSSSSVQDCIKEIKNISNGLLYALFNNAAYGQPGAVEDLSREVLREQFETNVFGTHQLTVGLLPELLAQKNARIIQNSSILGFAAMPMRGAYNASKFALEGLSDTLRLELHNTSVKVSIIEPGPIVSRFRARGFSELKKNINFEASRHVDLYAAAVKRLDSEDPSTKFTLPPEAVLKRVRHALTSNRPKERYYVTVPTYLFAGLRHILPTFVMDKILRSVS